jgi:hypothetical protein
MVTTYFAQPDAMPLVLDNLNPQIVPAHLRKDRVPVYSFNGGGLWLAKSGGSGKRIDGRTLIRFATLKSSCGQDLAT